ncbi:MAG: universal stress protein [Phycisphaeraceae bacterium]|nr:universal stress protein [Phycisphaeraceae bacterium]
MRTIKSILYPTDFSEHSQVAIPLALDLAKRYDAELHCLHAVDTTHEYFMQGGTVAPMMAKPLSSEALLEEAHNRMADFVAQHVSQAGNSVLTVVVEGKPFEQVIRYARDKHIDLIVMGTHGHSALASMLLGSVTEKVIHKAPCAVLTIRHPQQVFKTP